MLAIEIADEAAAAIATVIVFGGIGLLSWMLATMVRVTSNLARVEARLDEAEKDSERRHGEAERRIAALESRRS